jgi:cytochrome c-type biogenesis protein
MEVNFITALIGGLLSFASPCVLPIVPGYLSFITGMGLDELTQKESRKKVVRAALTNSVTFVIGFSVVFVLLGASATAVGKFLQEYMGVFSKIAGVVLIIFGLHMIGVVKIPFLLYEKRIHQEEKATGILRSFSAGLLFAFGWTPCIGPILAGILAIAATTETAQQGMALLSVYSLGLGIPFILSAVFLNAFFSVFSRIKTHLHKVEIAGGVILVALGALIFTNKLGLVSQQLSFINLENILTPESSSDTLRSGTSVTSADTKASVNADENNVAKLDFELVTVDGKTIRLSDFKGRVVAVNFWAPWCGPCRLETPGFVKIYKKYKNKGLVIIGVAAQTNESDVKKFIADYGVPYYIGISDKAAEQYNIIGLPTTYLFDRDGKAATHFVGYTPEPRFETALLMILERGQNQKGN